MYVKPEFHSLKSSVLCPTVKYIQRRRFARSKEVCLEVVVSYLLICSSGVAVTHLSAVH